MLPLDMESKTGVKTLRGSIVIVYGAFSRLCWFSGDRFGQGM
jgi:hypothetical protein